MNRSLSAIFVCAALGLAGCSAPGRVASFLYRAGCETPGAYSPAARFNAAAMENLVWSPFGRPERGWAVYAPRLQQEIRTGCPPQSAGFAARMARWQRAHDLRPDGAVDADSFQVIKGAWQAERPFHALRAQGVCPDPPPRAELVALPDDEVWADKTILMRRQAAEALGRMLAAAWREEPRTARGPDRLVAFSGFRSPEDDAERCARDHDCDGVGRAVCSAHRTGQAVDLALGAAPGYAIDSSADANRLYQSRTPAYRWLVDNAARYGFVNYPFEPWHWEWTGEAP